MNRDYARENFQLKMPMKTTLVKENADECFGGKFDANPASRYRRTKQATLVLSASKNEWGSERGGGFRGLGVSRAYDRAGDRRRGQKNLRFFPRSFLRKLEY